jgi:hypothetical protein
MRNEVSARGGDMGSMNCGALEASGPRGRLFTLTLYEGPVSSCFPHSHLTVSGSFLYTLDREDILSQRQDYRLPSLWIRGSSIAIVALQLLGAGGC